MWVELLVAFLLGAVFAILSSYLRKAKYDGVIEIDEDEHKFVYSVDFAHPYEIQKKKNISLKVIRARVQT